MENLQGHENGALHEQQTTINSWTNLTIDNIALYFTDYQRNKKRNGFSATRYTYSVQYIRI